MTTDLYRLDAVVMPLVEVLKDAHLSWAQRVETSWAIRVCLNHYQGLMAEQNKVSSETSYVLTTEREEK